MTAITANAAAQIPGRTALGQWKLTLSRFDKRILSLTEDQLQQQVAPGRNRLLYLLGHLTAVHDRMLPLLGLGEVLHPELDQPYLANPDKALPDPLSTEDLKKAWTEVNSRLTAELEKLSPEDWLLKHTSVSEEDFAKDPTRNRLAIVIGRTSHLAFHSGQAILVA